MRCYQRLFADPGLWKVPEWLPFPKVLTSKGLQAPWSAKCTLDPCDLALHGAQALSRKAWNYSALIISGVLTDEEIALAIPCSTRSIEYARANIRRFGTATATRNPRWTPSIVWPSAACRGLPELGTRRSSIITNFRGEINVLRIIWKIWAVGLVNHGSKLMVTFGTTTACLR